MATQRPEQTVSQPRPAVIRWLLDSDPAIRWQVLRDLTQASEEEVAAERARVATEGWGAHLLALQGPDGTWGDDITRPKWHGTLHTLKLLWFMGLDPASAPAQRALDLIREHFTWGPEFGNTTFFEGEVEPCINGGVLALGAYFGEIDDRLLERLLGEQLADGGWNCEAPPSRRASFHTTICVLEGLLAYEQARGPDAAVTAALARGHDYLLARRMFRSLSSGEVINRDWLRFSFPFLWRYDVLRGLDYLRSAGVAPDERAAEAVALVAQKQDPNGRWPLENPHPERGDFEMEGAPGTPSRWNTLRALRVLDWYSTPA